MTAAWVRPTLTIFFSSVSAGQNGTPRPSDRYRTMKVHNEAELCKLINCEIFKRQKLFLLIFVFTVLKHNNL